MASVLSAITNTIPITQFSRGHAGKIFDEVKRCDVKVVMKNNTAECVLLSPEKYVHLMDEVYDARLLAMASVKSSSIRESPDGLEIELHRIKYTMASF